MVATQFLLLEKLIISLLSHIRTIQHKKQRTLADINKEAFDVFKIEMEESLAKT